MSKKKTLLNLLISFLIIAVLCLIVLSIKQFLENKKLADELLSKKIEEDNQLLASFVNCLQGEPSFDINKDPKDLYFITARALIDKDESGCLEISDQQAQKHCLRDFFRFTAFDNPNVSESDCQKFFSEKNEQLFCLATLKKDLGTCSLIETPLKKEICKAVISLDSKYCESLSGDFDSQGVCSSREKGQKEIKNTCGIIGEEKAKSLCFNNFYLVKALREKDINLCDKIDTKTTPFAVLFCRVSLSPKPQEDFQEFYNDYSCYVNYAAKVAKIKNDPSFCEKIPLRDSVYQQVYQDCLSQFK